MEISQYLNEKHVCCELQAQNKMDAINELAGLLKDCPDINDFDQFLKDVFEREAAMTTGIGNEIAIPHARTEAVNNLIVAIGRSTKGISFEAMDNQPVKLVFLIGTPQKDMNTYLKALAYLTRLLKKDSFRQKLINAENSKEMISAFLQTQG